MTKKAKASIIVVLYEIVSTVGTSWIGTTILKFQTALYEKEHYLPKDGYGPRSIGLNPIVYLGPIVFGLNILVGYLTAKYCEDAKVPILSSILLYGVFILVSGLFLLFGNPVGVAITITLWILTLLTAVPYISAIAVGAFIAKSRQQQTENQYTDKMIFCPHCGRYIEPSDIFCRNCGYRLK